MQDIEHIGASAAVADDADLGRDPRRASANPLSQVLGLFTRTGGFYARSWGAYLDREPGEIPVARPTLALATEACFDEIVLTGFRLLRSAPDAARLEWITREVSAALEFYGQQGWLEKPEGFFAASPALTDVTVKTVNNMGRTYERLFFDSGYEPHAGEPGRERWLSYTGNNREYGLMLRHRQPRPWLVCVHGAEMGRAALDPTLFRAWHLHSDLGLNVVLPVLPMHGPRARGLPKGAAFPSEDVLNDVHGAAQAVWDIRRLLSWIRSQQPDSMIGLNGIYLCDSGRPGRRSGRAGQPPRRPQRSRCPRSDDEAGQAHRPDDLPICTDSPRADAGPLHLRRHRRQVGAPTRPGHPALAALGQTPDPLVLRRPHRVLPLPAGTAIHRRRAGAVGACRPGTDTSQTLTQPAWARRPAEPGRGFSRQAGGFRRCSSGRSRSSRAPRDRRERRTRPRRRATRPSR